MKIYIRNPERKDWMSGYGVINRALNSMNDTLDDDAADVHLFISPPYSFLDLDATKFNVGLTMTERHNLKSYKWHGRTFVQYANQMDLLIAPGQWCRDIFTQQLEPPTEMVLLGHDHQPFFIPVRPGPNRRALIMDRGRDQKDSTRVLADCFTDINYVNCKTPKPDGSEKNTDLIKKGRYTPEEIQQFYREADVLFKWGREGWCFPILEAMSSGCLVITNCVHLGYIEPDKNCLVFRSIDHLHECLRRAERDPLTKMKEAGQATAASLTWERAKNGIRDAISKHYRRK